MRFSFENTNYFSTISSLVFIPNPQIWTTRELNFFWNYKRFSRNHQVVLIFNEICFLNFQKIAGFHWVFFSGFNKYASCVRIRAGSPKKCILFNFLNVCLTFHEKFYKNLKNLWKGLNLPLNLSKNWNFPHKLYL